MGVFSSKFDPKQVKDAVGFGKTPYMNEPGEYIICAGPLKFGSSQKNKNHYKAVFEFTIVETASDKHPVGAHRSDPTTIDPGDEKSASAKLGGVKQYLEALSGVPQSEIDGAFFDAIEADPLKYEGIYLKLQVDPEIITSNKRPFTPRSYYPMPEGWTPNLAPKGETRAEPTAPAQESKVEATPTTGTAPRF